MVSAFRLIRVLTGVCFLWLGVTNCQSKADPTREAGWPADAMKMDPSEDPRPMTESIKGEVLRVEGTNYVVKREDGREVSVYADSATQIIGDINEGYKIEVEVNPQHHVESIRSTSTTDRPRETSESMLVQ
jgi:hypothetical protein